MDSIGGLRFRMKYILERSPRPRYAWLASSASTKSFVVLFGMESWIRVVE